MDAKSDKTAGSVKFSFCALALRLKVGPLCSCQNGSRPGGLSEHVGGGAVWWALQSLEQVSCSGVQSSVAGPCKSFPSLSEHVAMRTCDPGELLLRFPERHGLPDSRFSAHC